MSYIYISLVVGGGALIQGAIGFAFGIFSIPLLVFIGMPLEQAITLVLGLVVIQTLASVWRNRADIPWSEVIAISIPRFLSVVLGVYLLRYVRQHWSATDIKQMIGVCLLAVIAVQIWIRPQPRNRLSAGWTWLAGIASGTMAGLTGMGGPAIVLWVVAHDWTSHKSRLLMWCAFSLMVPWQLAVTYHRFGAPVLKSAALGVAYIPIVVLATMLGTRIGNHISQARLRVIAYTVLAGVGLASVVSPWMGS